MNIIKSTRALRLKAKPKPTASKKKPKTQPFIKHVVRTPGTIIKTLNSGQRNTSGNPGHYVVCRTNPFAGHGGSAIPDGKNSNFVVTDTFAVNNFNPTAAGQTIVIQTLNTLPALAMIGSTTNLVVDTVTVTGLTSLQPIANAPGSSYYPICIPGPYAGTGAPGVLFADPYTSTTARMISCGYRLIYTGPATTCSGSITITPNPIGWSTLTGAPTGQSFAPPTLAGAAGTAYAAGVIAVDADMNINPNFMTRASFTIRPEQGLVVVPQHRSNTFKLQPTYDMPYFPVCKANLATGAVTQSGILRPVSGMAPGVVWFDNDWMTYQIVLSGLNADASFRLESVACIEYNPAVSSPFYPMTIKASPNKPAEITQAAKVLETKDMRPS